MPRKIDHKRISFNAAFGISPEQLAKEITRLPLTARVLTIDTVARPGLYTTHVDVTYYTQPAPKDKE